MLLNPIGFVTRDIQIWTRSCTAAATTISATAGSGTTFNSSLNSFEFCVDGNNQLSFDIQASSTVNIEMLNSILPTGATFTLNPTTPLSSNTITGTFNWTPTFVDIAGSPYSLNLIINDDVCPMPNSSSITYQIILSNPCDFTTFVTIIDATSPTACDGFASPQLSK